MNAYQEDPTRVCVFHLAILEIFPVAHHFWKMYYLLSVVFLSFGSFLRYRLGFKFVFMVVYLLNKFSGNQTEKLR